MKNILFNPFTRYAGIESVLIGSVIILITCLLAYVGHIHLDGVIDLHVASNNMIKSVAAPTFTDTLLQGLINWASMVLFIFIAGKILSRSSVRFIDVLGTQAMARFPFLPACLFTILLFDENIIRYFEAAILKKENVPQPAISEWILFGLMSLLMLACIIWTIVLMYRAYSVSCNIKGGRSIVSFIVCVMLAETLSKVLISYLL